MTTIHRYENVLEDHVAEYIHMEMKNLSWKYDYKSNINEVNNHWHIIAGHNPKECVDSGFEWLLPLWDAAKIKYKFEDKYGVQDFVRLYMNAHTHGIEPHLHIDDGAFTMIYYPRIDWKPEWGGGTLVDGQLVPYVGNSLVVFDAHLPHMAMSVSRQCYELRTCVVFKCYTKNV